MYIQENPAEQHTAPPDYSGHTYVPPPPSFAPQPPSEEGATEVGEARAETLENEKSAPVGAFLKGEHASCAENSGKRGDLFGGSGLGGILSRIPFLSSLAPPPRRCEGGARKHSELWDWVLLALVALSLFNGKDDDVLPLLLLLLLWD